MIVCIIIMALFFALFMLAMIDYIRIEDNNSDDAKTSLDAASSALILFSIILGLTIGLCVNSTNKKALYTDMATNSQNYSINDLKEAHKSIIRHKVYQGRWTSFYNGYEFPEINVDVMNSVDNTIHIVK